MEEQKRLERRIAEAVTRFQEEQMSVTAESVWVDLHPDSVVVTLRGATCPAERNCARDRQGREMLERLYSDVFNASKGPLERAVEEILGRSVERSRLSVDPQSGDHIILFALGDASCQHSGARCSENVKAPLE